MDLCSKGHEEVCYECRDCPVCDKQGELDKAAEEIQDSQKQIDSLNDALKQTRKI